MIKTLMIRTDTNTKIGSGHIMRCIALAQQWNKNGNISKLISSSLSPGLNKHIEAENIEFIELSAEPSSQEDANITSKICSQHNADWTVIDGYQFGDDYQQRIKSKGHKILFLDDYCHCNHYFADIVLNQNIYAKQSMYKNKEPYTKLLLGSKYVLLRSEFLQLDKIQSKNKEINNILVTLGGGDPDNQTLKVINGINLIENKKLNAKIIVGAMNPCINELERTIHYSTHNLSLIQNTSNMPELMDWANIAITNGGSTCWEAAYMGLPNIIIVLADNQEEIAKGLDRAGISLNLGWYNDLSTDDIASAINRLISDQDLMNDMREKGKELVDGNGRERVLANMC